MNFTDDLRLSESILIMSALALPVAVCATGRILYFGFKKEINIFDTITLTFTELN